MRLLPLAVALVSLVPWSSSSLSSSVADVVELRPETSLPSQSVLYGVPQLFRVVKLRPTSVYDIKVSYPATQPSLFTLKVKQVVLPRSRPKIAETKAKIARNFVKSPRHRVLNTVKLRLHPNEVDKHASVQYRLEPSETAVEVEFSLLAEVEGVRHPDAKFEVEKCVFDIVVEEVVLKVFPRKTVVLIGWLVMLLFVSGKWVLPYLEKKIALGCVEDRVEMTQTKES